VDSKGHRHCRECNRLCQQRRRLTRKQATEAPAPIDRQQLAIPFRGRASHAAGGRRGPERRLYANKEGGRNSTCDPHELGEVRGHG
jgi:hypothetical protein